MFGKIVSSINNNVVAPTSTVNTVSINKTRPAACDTNRDIQGFQICRR